MSSFLLILRLMIRDLTLITTELTTVAHLLMSVVLFYFARRSVRYLSQAWIMLLFGLMYVGMYLCILFRVMDAPGILHPGMLVYLLVCSYLQGIYPLGIAMPGYLQWGRMWRYAAPAIFILLIYVVGVLVGSNVIKVYEPEDLSEQFLSGDVVLRFLALGFSFYYIINIFVLPHRLVKKMELPRDQIFYGTLLGVIAVLFVGLTIHFDHVGFIVYQLFFTATNLFLSFRILRPVLDDMRLPEITPVETPPDEAELLKSAEDDFNESNKQRFARIEYYMQTEKPYTDPTFNRDVLCRHAGFNRHLVLQTLRSQGYNDVHEYISRYRVSEMRLAIEEGVLVEQHQVEKYGFKTYKTAVLAYGRYEGRDLNVYLRPKKSAATEQWQAKEEAASDMPQDNGDD